MFGTATKTALIVLALVVGFLIFQQMRTNERIDNNVENRDQSFSYLDHERDKFETYQSVGDIPSNDLKITQISNNNKVLSNRVQTLDGRTKELIKEKRALEAKFNVLSDQNQKLSVENNRLASENTTLKVKIKEMERSFANPQPKDKTTSSHYEETNELLGLIFDIPTETFHIKGIKQAI